MDSQQCFYVDEESPASVGKDGQPESSEDESGRKDKRYDLPSELLLQTLQYLEDSCAPWDRYKFLVPATLVSRRWHDLARPLMFKAIRFTPSKAPRLLAVLNSTRNWAKCVTSLRISFSVHYNPNCTPVLLSLIASCVNLERLDLVGCGKPVYKSFLAQSDSVLYADDLFKVFGRIRHLVLTGGRKKGSTGLDAAKLTSFLLPHCSSLQCLERGEISFQTIQCAILQPMTTSTATFNAPTPQAGSLPMPSLSHLRSLTLASSTLSSRAFTQALSILHPSVVQEIVVRANNAPTRRYFDDMVKVFGNNLRSLKLDIMFPEHRLYQVFDGLPMFCPNLRILDVRGPIVTDLLLNSLPLHCQHLRKLVIMHSRAVSPTGIIKFLTQSPAPQNEPSKLLIMDDLLASAWTQSIQDSFRQLLPTLNSSWDVQMSDFSWWDPNGDEAVYGGQRRIALPSQRLESHWEASPEAQSRSDRLATANMSEYVPTEHQRPSQSATPDEALDVLSAYTFDGDEDRPSIGGERGGLIDTERPPTLESETEDEERPEISTALAAETSHSNASNVEESSVTSSESSADSDGEDYESDWDAEREIGILPVRTALQERDSKAAARLGSMAPVLTAGPSTFFDLPSASWFPPHPAFDTNHHSFSFQPERPVTARGFDSVLPTPQEPVARRRDHSARRI